MWSKFTGVTLLLAIVYPTLAQDVSKKDVDKIIQGIFNLPSKPNANLEEASTVTNFIGGDSDPYVSGNSDRTPKPSDSNYNVPVAEKANEDQPDDLSTSPPGPLFNISKPVPGAETGQRVGDCTCVPYYLCKNDSTVNVHGVGIIDIRIRPQAKCKSYMDVCCKVPTNDPNDKVLPIPVITGTKASERGCGVRNQDGVGFRIVGDQDGEAQFGEFPWMVAIINEQYLEGGEQPLKVYQCGGSLIHPQVVLTAAHCVPPQKINTLKVRAGEWDTQTKQEIYPYQERDIERVVVHKNYYAGALFNDIALLFLREPVEIAENVDIICLPPQGEIYDNSRCIASGWGKNVFGAIGRYQVILKKVTLDVVPREICEDQLRNTRLGEYFQLHESFVCAGGLEGRDTCKGDGGSPLVCPIKGAPGRYVQVGIVAWGIECGMENVPGVYVNVPEFHNWIEEEMHKERINNFTFNYIANERPYGSNSFN